ncbi:MAG TPA: hypothetical protein VJJ75_00560 [Candidatus Nanoarchaeia archaeon]|nr:hypothetical protein [Candidatus Nanoarchaeia archaeon]
MRYLKENNPWPLFVDYTILLKKLNISLNNLFAGLIFGVLPYLIYILLSLNDKIGLFALVSHPINIPFILISIFLCGILNVIYHYKKTSFLFRETIELFFIFYTLFSIFIIGLGVTGFLLGVIPY